MDEMLCEGTDRITKLPDRHSLEEAIISYFNETVVEVDSCDKGERHYSIILFDADYFKAVNDLFGYQQGDSVLAGIGDVLREYGHSNQDFLGIYGRWSGEEFLVALPYDSSKRARYIADEIRELVARYTFEDVKTKTKTLKDFITISVGVSSVDVTDFVGAMNLAGRDLTEEEVRERLERLIFESNCAMDYAKFMGKNRVEEFRRYLHSELENLEEVRQFYFRCSRKKPSELSSILGHKFFQGNKQITNKLKKHFYFIRTELNPKDTRTQALLADNLYRYVAESHPEQKEGFLQFLRD